MNTHAQQLGRLARGKPKRFSAIELERRRIRLADARLKRWSKRTEGLTDKQTKE